MATFTNSIKVTNVTLSSTVPQYSQRAWTGVELRRLTGIQYYKLQFTLNFEVKNRREVQAFIAEYQAGKPFTLSLGSAGLYQGTQTGAVTATAAATIGSMVVSTNTNNFQAGDMIQFTSHKKLYQIVSKTANTITIFPQLRQNVGVNEVINYNNLVIEARLDVDQTFDMGISNVTSIQFNATENL